VAAFFPVTTTALPDTIAEEDWAGIRDTETSYATYLVETAVVLDQLTPAEFAPDLTLLDADEVMEQDLTISFQTSKKINR